MEDFQVAAGTWGGTHIQNDVAAYHAEVKITG